MVHCRRSLACASPQSAEGQTPGPAHVRGRVGQVLVACALTFLLGLACSKRAGTGRQDGGPVDSQAGGGQGGGAAGGTGGLLGPDAPAGPSMGGVTGSGGASGGPGTAGSTGGLTGSGGASTGPGTGGSTGGGGGSGTGGLPGTGGRTSADAALDSSQICGERACASGEQCCDSGCPVCVPQAVACSRVVCTDGGNSQVYPSDCFEAPSCTYSYCGNGDKGKCYECNTTVLGPPCQTAFINATSGSAFCCW